MGLTIWEAPRDPSGARLQMQAILDVMPCSPAIHARSEFDLCHKCGRTLAFCGVCSWVYARQTLRIGALRCLLSTCLTGVPSGN